VPELFIVRTKKSLVRHIFCMYGRISDMSLPIYRNMHVPTVYIEGETWRQGANNNKRH
jgi:hypothetical protein